MQKFRWVRLLVVLALIVGPATAHAQKVRLKDGRYLEGRMLPISGVADNPLAYAGDDSDPVGSPILLVDDELRRVFVPKFFLAEVVDQASQPLVKITPWQPVVRQGNTLGSVGASLGIEPFDKFGRRTYSMQTSDGPLAIVQGITELTPRYAKVEALESPQRRIVWDMRMATSSIPRDTLAEILDTAVDKSDSDNWIQIVRFYLQAERYGEARRELEKIIAKFPEKQDLVAEANQLRQQSARRILREIELRREAGQHELVSELLTNFPPEEVAGETLQQVRKALSDYEADERRLHQAIELLQSIAAEMADPDHRKLVEPLVAEVAAQLSHNTLDRLAPFLQLAGDDALPAEQKVALAITGWLLGAENADQNVAVAISLVQVRDAVRKYLSETDPLERNAILDGFPSMEGASIERVAQLIAHMKPVWEIPAGADHGFGYYELTAPGHSENGDYQYAVQLPPEYDPYRKYPTLVSLCGANNSARQELDFWAGTPATGADGRQTAARRGQAMRHGYITISIAWKKPQQYRYEYSLREHEAVLATLRDACRRFGVDTDRVFLTGHGIGGNAAWDIAISHPDLWAGVIPFVAVLDPVNKYQQFYWDNGAYVPMVFVCGEKDGLKMSKNADLFDKYFLKRFDVTVVEYLGRGHEPFHDEIQEIFSWMAMPQHRRAGPPQEFSCKTMRPWDNFFWWIEGRGFPNQVLPGNWPQRGASPTQVEGRLLGERLTVKTAAAETTIWLGPDLVDFDKSEPFRLNGRRVSFEPSLAVLLEDVRTRGDRQRPFWAKLELP